MTVRNDLPRGINPLVDLLPVVVSAPKTPAPAVAKPQPENTYDGLAQTSEKPALQTLLGTLKTRGAPEQRRAETERASAEVLSARFALENVKNPKERAAAEASLAAAQTALTAAIAALEEDARLYRQLLNSDGVDTGSPAALGMSEALAKIDAQLATARARGALAADPSVKARFENDAAIARPWASGGDKKLEKAMEKLGITASELDAFVFGEVLAGVSLRGSKLDSIYDTYLNPKNAEKDDWARYMVLNAAFTARAQVLRKVTPSEEGAELKQAKELEATAKLTPNKIKPSPVASARAKLLEADALENKKPPQTEKAAALRNDAEAKLKAEITKHADTLKKLGITPPDFSQVNWAGQLTQSLKSVPKTERKQIAAVYLALSTLEIGRAKTDWATKKQEFAAAAATFEKEQAAYTQALAERGLTDTLLAWVGQDTKPKKPAPPPAAPTIDKTRAETYLQTAAIYDPAVTKTKDYRMKVVDVAALGFDVAMTGKQADKLKAQADDSITALADAAIVPKEPSKMMLASIDAAISLLEQEKPLTGASRRALAQLQAQRDEATKAMVDLTLTGAVVKQSALAQVEAQSANLQAIDATVKQLQQESAACDAWILDHPYDAGSQQAKRRDEISAQLQSIAKQRADVEAEQRAASAAANTLGANAPDAWSTSETSTGSLRADDPMLRDGYAAVGTAIAASKGKDATAGASALIDEAGASRERHGAAFAAGAPVEKALWLSGSTALKAFDAKTKNKQAAIVGAGSTQEASVTADAYYAQGLVAKEDALTLARATDEQATLAQTGGKRVAEVAAFASLKAQGEAATSAATYFDSLSTDAFLLTAKTRQAQLTTTPYEMAADAIVAGAEIQSALAFAAPQSASSEALLGALPREENLGTFGFLAQRGYEDLKAKYPGGVPEDLETLAQGFVSLAPKAHAAMELFAARKDSIAKARSAIDDAAKEAKARLKARIEGDTEQSWTEAGVSIVSAGATGAEIGAAAGGVGALPGAAVGVGVGVVGALATWGIGAIYEGRSDAEIDAAATAAKAQLDAYEQQVPPPPDIDVDDWAAGWGAVGRWSDSTLASATDPVMRAYAHGDLGFDPSDATNTYSTLMPSYWQYDAAIRAAEDKEVKALDDSWLYTGAKLVKTGVNAAGAVAGFSLVARGGAKLAALGLSRYAGAEKAVTSAMETYRLFSSAAEAGFQGSRLAYTTYGLGTGALSMVAGGYASEAAKAWAVDTFGADSVAGQALSMLADGMEFGIASSASGVIHEAFEETVFSIFLGGAPVVAESVFRQAGWFDDPKKAAEKFGEYFGIAVVAALSARSNFKRYGDAASTVAKLDVPDGAKAILTKAYLQADTGTLNVNVVQALVDAGVDASSAAKLAKSVAIKNAMVAAAEAKPKNRAEIEAEIASRVAALTPAECTGLAMQYAYGEMGKPLAKGQVDGAAFQKRYETSKAGFALAGFPQPEAIAVSFLREELGRAWKEGGDWKLLARRTDELTALDQAAMLRSGGPIELSPDVIAYYNGVPCAIGVDADGLLSLTAFGESTVSLNDAQAQAAIFGGALQIRPKEKKPPAVLTPAAKVAQAFTPAAKVADPKAALASTPYGLELFENKVGMHELFAAKDGSLFTRAFPIGFSGKAYGVIVFSKGEGGALVPRFVMGYASSPGEVASWSTTDGKPLSAELSGQIVSTARETERQHEDALSKSFSEKRTDPKAASQLELSWPTNPFISQYDKLGVRLSDPEVARERGNALAVAFSAAVDPAPMLASFDAAYPEPRSPELGAMRAAIAESLADPIFQMELAAASYDERANVAALAFQARARMSPVPYSMAGFFDVLLPFAKTIYPEKARVAVANVLSGGTLPPNERALFEMLASAPKGSSIAKAYACLDALSPAERTRLGDVLLAGDFSARLGVLQLLSDGSVGPLLQASVSDAELKQHVALAAQRAALANAPAWEPARQYLPHLAPKHFALVDGAYVAVQPKDPRVAVTLSDKNATFDSRVAVYDVAKKANVYFDVVAKVDRNGETLLLVQRGDAFELVPASQFSEFISGSVALDVPDAELKAYTENLAKLSAPDRAALLSLMSTMSSKEEQLLYARVFNATTSVAEVQRFQRLLTSTLGAQPWDPKRLLQVGTVAGLAQYYKYSCVLTVTQYQKAQFNPLFALEYIAMGKQGVMDDQFRAAKNAFAAVGSSDKNLVPSTNTAKPTERAIGAPEQVQLGSAVPTDWSGSSAGLNDAEFVAALNLEVGAFTGVTYEVVAPNDSAAAEAALFEAMQNPPREGIAMALWLPGGSASHAYLVLKVEANPRRYFVRNPEGIGEWISADVLRGNNPRSPLSLRSLYPRVGTVSVSPAAPNQASVATGASGPITEVDPSQTQKGFPALKQDPLVALRADVKARLAAMTLASGAREALSWQLSVLLEQCASVEAIAHLEYSLKAASGLAQRVGITPALALLQLERIKDAPWREALADPATPIEIQRTLSLLATTRTNTQPSEVQFVDDLAQYIFDHPETAALLGSAAAVLPYDSQRWLGFLTQTAGAEADPSAAMKAGVIALLTSVGSSDSVLPLMQHVFDALATLPPPSAEQILKWQQEESLKNLVADAASKGITLDATVATTAIAAQSHQVRDVLAAYDSLLALATQPQSLLKHCDELAVLFSSDARLAAIVTNAIALGASGALAPNTLEAFATLSQKLPARTVKRLTEKLGELSKTSSPSAILFAIDVITRDYYFGSARPSTRDVFARLDAQIEGKTDADFAAALLAPSPSIFDRAVSLGEASQGLARLAKNGSTGDRQWPGAKTYAQDLEALDVALFPTPPSGKALSVMSPAELAQQQAGLAKFARHFAVAYFDMVSTQLSLAGGRAKLEAAFAEFLTGRLGRPATPEEVRVMMRGINEIVLTRNDSFPALATFASTRFLPALSQDQLATLRRNAEDILAEGGDVRAKLETLLRQAGAKQVTAADASAFLSALGGNTNAIVTAPAIKGVTFFVPPGVSQEAVAFAVESLSVMAKLAGVNAFVPEQLIVLTPPGYGLSDWYPGMEPDWAGIYYARHPSAGYGFAVTPIEGAAKGIYVHEMGHLLDFVGALKVHAPDAKGNTVEMTLEEAVTLHFEALKPFSPTEYGKTNPREFIAEMIRHNWAALPDPSRPLDDPATNPSVAQGSFAYELFASALKCTPDALQKALRSGKYAPKSVTPPTRPAKSAYPMPKAAAPKPAAVKVAPALTWSPRAKLTRDGSEGLLDAAKFTNGTTLRSVCGELGISFQQGSDRDVFYSAPFPASFAGDQEIVVVVRRDVAGNAAASVFARTPPSGALKTPLGETLDAKTQADVDATVLTNKKAQAQVLKPASAGAPELPIEQKLAALADVDVYLRGKDFADAEDRAALGALLLVSSVVDLKTVQQALLDAAKRALPELPTAGGNFRDVMQRLVDDPMIVRELLTLPLGEQPFALSSYLKSTFKLNAKKEVYLQLTKNGGDRLTATRDALASQGLTLDEASLASIVKANEASPIDLAYEVIDAAAIGPKLTTAFVEVSGTYAAQVAVSAPAPVKPAFVPPQRKASDKTADLTPASKLPNALPSSPAAPAKKLRPVVPVPDSDPFPSKLAAAKLAPGRADGWKKIYQDLGQLGAYAGEARALFAAAVTAKLPQLDPRSKDAAASAAAIDAFASYLSMTIGSSAPDSGFAIAQQFADAQVDPVIATAVLDAATRSVGDLVAGVSSDPLPFLKGIRAFAFAQAVAKLPTETRVALASLLAGKTKLEAALIVSELASTLPQLELAPAKALADAVHEYVDGEEFQSVDEGLRQLAIDMSLRSLQTDGATFRQEQLGDGSCGPFQALVAMAQAKPSEALKLARDPAYRARKELEIMAQAGSPITHWLVDAVSGSSDVRLTRFCNGDASVLRSLLTEVSLVVESIDAYGSRPGGINAKLRGDEAFTRDPAKKKWIELEDTVRAYYELVTGERAPVGGPDGSWTVERYVVETLKAQRAIDARAALVEDTIGKNWWRLSSDEKAALSAAWGRAGGLHAPERKKGETAATPNRDANASPALWSAFDKLSARAPRTGALGKVLDLIFAIFKKLAPDLPKDARIADFNDFIAVICKTKIALQKADVDPTQSGGTFFEDYLAQIETATGFRYERGLRPSFKDKSTGEVFFSDWPEKPGETTLIEAVRRRGEVMLGIVAAKENATPGRYVEISGFGHALHIAGYDDITKQFVIFDPANGASYRASYATLFDPKALAKAFGRTKPVVIDDLAWPVAQRSAADPVANTGGTPQKSKAYSSCLVTDQPPPASLPPTTVDLRKHYLQYDNYSATFQYMRNEALKRLLAANARDASEIKVREMPVALTLADILVLRDEMKGRNDTWADIITNWSDLILADPPDVAALTACESALRTLIDQTEEQRLQAELAYWLADHGETVTLIDHALVDPGTGDVLTDIDVQTAAGVRIEVTVGDALDKTNKRKDGGPGQVELLAPNGSANPQKLPMIVLASKLTPTSKRAVETFGAYAVPTVDMAFRLYFAVKALQVAKNEKAAWANDPKDPRQPLPFGVDATASAYAELEKKGSPENSVYRAYANVPEKKGKPAVNPHMNNAELMGSTLMASHLGLGEVFAAAMKLPPKLAGKKPSAADVEKARAELAQELARCVTVGEFQAVLAGKPLPKPPVAPALSSAELSNGLFE
jgi:hypothetical protein